jgi:hypothetical protein
MPSHQGQCVSCHAPTDSGLALFGRAEWLRSALVMLGVAYARAFRLVRALNPGGDRPMTVWACANCAFAFTVGLVAAGRLPVAHQ